MSIKVTDLRPGTEIFSIYITSGPYNSLKAIAENNKNTNKKLFEVHSLIVDKVVNIDDKIYLFIWCNDEAIDYGVLEAI